MHPGFVMVERGRLRGFTRANPDSPVGQALLMFQVLLRHVLLAALVTRLGVLFTAGGPSGTFPDDRGPWWRRLVQALRVDVKLVWRWWRRRRNKGREKSP